jgi:type II secretory pathway component PulF
MNVTTPSAIESDRGWFGPLTILALHCLAFLLMYATLVFMGPTFVEHYQAYGIAPTARFEFVTSLSNWLSAYTPIVLLAVAVNAAMVIWLARRARDWLSAYSHAVLAVVGCGMFVTIAWLFQPMAMNERAAGNAGAAAQGDAVIASVEI